MESDRSKIQLLPAQLKDNQFLWQVRNDPDTRQNSVTQEVIPYEDHLNWLTFALNSDYYSIWVIADEKGNPIGQLRFDLNEDKTAELAIALVKEKRGMGYGSAALSSALKTAYHLLGLKGVYAYVKPDNTASLKAFLKAGFQKEEETLVHNILCLKLIHRKEAG